MEKTLMSKLLDGQDKIYEKLTMISERVVRVEDTVKRHDEYNFPKMEQSIEEIKMNAKRDAKIVEDLCRVVSRSDGRMKTMENDIIANSESIKANSVANKMISDITISWKVGKWVIGGVVSIILFILSVKSIIHGGIKEGLQAIKDIIL